MANEWCATAGAAASPTVKDARTPAMVRLRIDPIFTATIPLVRAAHLTLTRVECALSIFAKRKRFRYSKFVKNNSTGPILREDTAAALSHSVHFARAAGERNR